jgi:hypothetical protein
MRDVRGGPLIARMREFPRTKMEHLVYAFGATCRRHDPERLRRPDIPVEPN